MIIMLRRARETLLPVLKALILKHANSNPRPLKPVAAVAVKNLQKPNRFSPAWPHPVPLLTQLRVDPCPVDRGGLLWDLLLFMFLHLEELVAIRRPLGLF